MDAGDHDEKRRGRGRKRNGGGTVEGEEQRNPQDMEVEMQSAMDLNDTSPQSHTPFLVDLTDVPLHEDAGFADDSQLGPRFGGGLVVLFDEVARSPEAVFYQSFELSGKRYFVGDYVYLHPPVGEAYVAVVEKIYHPPDKVDDLQCLVRWFYRPQDTHAGRLPAHEEDELFESDHRDVNEIASVTGRCLILSESEYARYRMNKKKAQLLKIDLEQELDVYFCRKGYSPSRSRFFPLTPTLSPFASLKTNPQVYVPPRPFLGAF